MSDTLIVAIITFFSSATGFAILSWIYKKVTNAKDKIKQKREQEMLKFLLETTLPDFIRREEYKERESNWVKQMSSYEKTVDTKLDRILRQQNKSEGMRIATDILSAADDIRDGRTISSPRYKYLLESFKYYKDVLHKNSYVEEQMNFIKEHMSGEENKIKIKNSNK